MVVDSSSRFEPDGSHSVDAALDASFEAGAGLGVAARVVGEEASFRFIVEATPEPHPDGPRCKRTDSWLLVFC